MMSSDIHFTVQKVVAFFFSKKKICSRIDFLIISKNYLGQKNDFRELVTFTHVRRKAISPVKCQNSVVDGRSNQILMPQFFLSYVLTIFFGSNSKTWCPSNQKMHKT